MIADYNWLNTSASTYTGKIMYCREALISHFARGGKCPVLGRVPCFRLSWNKRKILAYSGFLLA
ncbi:hypothetical protein E2C01_019045 [Portunus trituberculatus]|uniref:Uncharacterized protein n=1 Tax=Portunus trituberculatus TaxID=210409 RepID=A0A5B7DW92_PORTR|nr:hypothetical protein [Portunus trituberculatus]